MKISYKGDYALKALLELALNYSDQGTVVKSTAMAKKLDIPVKFLEAVLAELKRGGFVQSRRGQAGGYSLAKAPAKINIGQVVRYIDGPIEPIACVNDRYKNCRELNSCVFRKIWKNVDKAIAEVIDKVTLETLVAECGKKNVEYYI